MIMRPEGESGMHIHMAEKIPASVQILTFNNRDTIERCLLSVRDFDDVIALDGGSTDGTRDVLARCGARIYPQHEDPAFSGPISDFSLVRNRGLDRARHRWFLYIDSDEFFPPETIQEIASIVRAETPPGYLWYISRHPLIRGKVRDCGTAAPWLQMRMFHRDHAGRFSGTVHEKVRPLPDSKIGILKNPLIASQLDIEGYEKKLRQYLAIEEERIRGIPRRKLMRKLFHPLRAIGAAFLKSYHTFFCRASVPFDYEFARLKYNFVLFWLVVRRLIRVRGR